MSWKLFEVLVQAAGTTAVISLVSISIGLLIGVGVCAATMHHNPAIGRLGALVLPLADHQRGKKKSHL